MTFGGSREGVGIFYVYTFAYTYAGSRLKSLGFIGWFESSTEITASVAVFFRPKERADRKNGRQIRTADS